MKYDKEHIDKMTPIYTDPLVNADMWRTVINTVLSSDWDYTKMNNWQMSPHVYCYRKQRTGTEVKARTSAGH